MKYLMFIVSLVIVIPVYATAQKAEFGVASFYADNLEGKETALGDVYDSRKMVCAHKKYPYGTMLRVTRMDNNKSVVVKVIDRGPWVKGRVVDLSKAAAEKIGLVHDGIAEVKVEVVKQRTKKKDVKPTSTSATSTSSSDNVIPAEYADLTDKGAKVEKKETAKEEKLEPKNITLVQHSETVKGEEIRKGAFFDEGYFQLALDDSDEKGNYTVQVFSTNDFGKVLEQVVSLQSQWFKKILMSVEQKGKEVNYKLMLSSFSTQKTADVYNKNLAKRYKINGFVTSFKAPKSYSDMTVKGSVAPGLYQAEVLKSPGKGYGVQVGSFKDYNNLGKAITQYREKGVQTVLVNIHYQNGSTTPLKKLILGWFEDEDAAKTYKATLAKKYKVKGFVCAIE